MHGHLADRVGNANDVGETGRESSVRTTVYESFIL
jgi:hypothetical protein